MSSWTIAGPQPAAIPAPAHDYEELLAHEDRARELPELDEKMAAGLCYTSGTTGEPKGVLYSHRSTLLHAMAALHGRRRRDERE